MKKNLFWTALVGVALASCVSDEVANIGSQNEEARAITFNAPVMYGMTKAVAGEMGVDDGGNKVGYDKAEKFKVYAYYTESNLTTWWSGGQVYMNDVTVEYTSDVDGWAPQTDYYWPKTGYLTFVAYSPSDAGMTMETNGNLSLTNFERSNEATSQYDLMYSDLSVDRQSSENRYNGTEPNEYKGVDILFHHALSSIKFTAAKLDNYTGTTITITGITLSDVNSAANLTVTPAASSTAAWGYVGTPIAYTAFSGTTALTTTATSIGTNLILIPQSFSDETAKIEVKYSIKHQDSNEAIEQTHTVAIKTLTAEWQMGYRYTYNITIGLDKIYFAPIVESWNDATITDDINIGGNSTTGGTTNP